MGICRAPLPVPCEVLGMSRAPGLDRSWCWLLWSVLPLDGREMLRTCPAKNQEGNLVIKEAQKKEA